MFTIASPKTSFGVRSSRNERTPKDVCGEAMFTTEWRYFLKRYFFKPDPKRSLYGYKNIGFHPENRSEIKIRYETTSSRTPVL